jgi:hypothetical protein
LALKRPGVATATERSVPPPLPTTAAPAPLPTADLIGAGPVTTELPHEVRSEATLPIALDPTGSATTPGCGVAVFRADTGADFQWFPIENAMRGDDGRPLVHAAVEPGATWIVTIAAERAFARHGYVQRRVIEIPAATTTAAAVVTLPTALTAVQFTLPTDARRAGPLRLERADDPLWLPMDQSAANLVVTPGQSLSIALGAGSYALVDPFDQGRRVEFEVPGATTVDVSALASRTRDGRL